MRTILRKWVERLKIVAPIILLSIILPTWDVFSDLRLIIMTFNGNFAMCLRKWWEIAPPLNTSRRSYISYEYKNCPSDKFNCTLWENCKKIGKNYCMDHPEACALLGILDLYFRVWWLILLVLQFRSFLLTLKISTHGGLKHPIRNKHSCYPFWIFTHSLVGFISCNFFECWMLFKLFQRL